MSIRYLIINSYLGNLRNLWIRLRNLWTSYSSSSLIVLRTRMVESVAGAALGVG